MVDIVLVQLWVSYIATLLIVFIFLLPSAESVVREMVEEVADPIESANSLRQELVGNLSTNQEKLVFAEHDYQQWVESVGKNLPVVKKCCALKPLEVELDEEKALKAIALSRVKSRIVRPPSREEIHKALDMLE